jgi:uncharacterized membrane protein
MQRFLALASIVMTSTTVLAQMFVPMPGIGEEPGCNQNVCIVSGSGGYSGVRISDDGRFVVSLGYQSGFIDGAIPRFVVRWSPGTAPVVITPELQSLYPAVGISADGSVVLGDTWRWSTANGYEDLIPQLRDEQGIWNSLFFGLSDDAQVYGGIRGIYPDQGDMFTFRPQTGQRTIFARPAQVPTGYYYFNTMSGDGQVLAGSARQIATMSGQYDGYAPVIIRNGVPTLLLPVTDSNFQGVNDLNFDGSVAVGVFAQSFQMKAFRWTAAEGVQALDEDAPGNFGSSFARAVSRDGSVVVGEYLQFGAPGTRAWIWKAGVGFRDLQNELEWTYGLSEALSGWKLLVATDISGDGKSIVGQGRNPQGREQAFFVDLTVPTGCDDIDFNNNDVFPEDQDVIAFFNVLAGDDCPSCNDIDFNNNRVFPEDQDVIDFFNVLAGGNCP